MINFKEARKLVLEKVNSINFNTFISNKIDDRFLILDDLIAEKEYGWDFPYSNEKFLKTKSIKHAFAGNSPFFVDKYKSLIIERSSGISRDNFFEDYEEENEYWCLKIDSNLLTNNKILLLLKKKLKLDLNELKRLKNQSYNGETILSSGGQKKLESLKSVLQENGITGKIEFKFST
ncbi:hypothetical protein [Flammeovirga agarivorans]|uniref:Ribosomal protein L7/L12 C-terminal domain-containing protein n=1 Tax=Flammeovirga agarivorans TaxID=2726742 RepID=A0A7X8SRI5_9BACT|nr:hypothetical protein [Flammeovirga agarivorans]NLR95050.1 hypothetical protein [Flammeovirga agarivorans]